MPLRAHRGAELVNLIGEAKVRALEERLPLVEKQLEDMGVGWKSTDAQALRTALCVGPGCDGDGVGVGYAVDGEETAVLVAPAPRLAGATTFAAADQFDEAAALEANAEAEISTFRQLLDNIFSDVDLAMSAKLERVQATASDLAARLGKGAGEKALAAPAPPAAVATVAAARYVADLGLASGPALDAEAVEAVKALEGSPQPAAALVSELIRQGAVQG